MMIFWIMDDRKNIVMFQKPVIVDKNREHQLTVWKIAYLF